MRWIECRWYCRQIEDLDATANWEPQGDGHPPSGVCVCVSMSCYQYSCTGDWGVGLVLYAAWKPIRACHGAGLALRPINDKQ